MQFRKPFTYFAGKPKKGWTNVLIGTVCTFVPIAGPMVLLGYRAEIADELARDPDRERYPDFSADHLMRYLQRGIWPFVALLLASLPALAVGVGLGIAAGLAYFQATGNQLVSLLIGEGVFVLVALALSVLAWPFEIFAMKSQAFRPMESLRFSARFLRMVGPEMVVAAFVHGAITLGLCLVDLLLCFVGVYPAAVIAQMAHQHFLVQLYQRYLEEGGEPVLAPPPDEDDGDDDDDYRRVRSDRPPPARRLDPDLD